MVSSHLMLTIVWSYVALVFMIMFYILYDFCIHERGGNSQLRGVARYLHLAKIVCKFGCKEEEAYIRKTFLLMQNICIIFCTCMARPFSFKSNMWCNMKVFYALLNCLKYLKIIYQTGFNISRAIFCYIKGCNLQWPFINKIINTISSLSSCQIHMDVAQSSSYSDAHKVINI